MSVSDKILEKAKSSGIEELEVINVKKKILTVRITSSEIFEVKQNQEEKTGIRMIDKKRIASAQTTGNIDIGKIIERLRQSLSNIEPKFFWNALPSKTSQKTNVDKTYDKKLENITEREATEIAQEMINCTLHKKIDDVTGSLNIVSENFEVSNTNNLRKNDKATYISGVINADSSYGGELVSGIGHYCCRTLSTFSADRVGNDAKNMCVDSIAPKKIESGKYTVILEPYSVGELLAFVICPNFDLKTHSEKRSCFYGKIGEKIGINELELVDDPHVPDAIGSKTFDDEGISTRQNWLIKKGIFHNTYSDSYTSFKEGKTTTANASRGGSPLGRDSEPIPTPATHNLRIKKGNTSQEDMIKDTKRGILVGRLWYTYAVNPLKGDFSCTARSGIMLIENGEVKTPAKQIRIVDNIPRLLQKISDIGNNEKNIVQWASSSSISPSIKIEEIPAMAF